MQLPPPCPATQGLDVDWLLPHFAIPLLIEHPAAMPASDRHTLALVPPPEKVK
jgi:hypothetical protein